MLGINPNYNSYNSSNPHKILFKRNETNHPQKKQISTGTKIAVSAGGITALALGIVYAIKKTSVKNIKNIQQIFQDVFLRDDITEKHAQEMLKRYKDIEKIKDDKKYISALFEEAKKNFKMENSGIKLKFDQSFEGAKDALGFYHHKDNVISITTTKGRKYILNTIHHEFRHAMQHRVSLSSYALELMTLCQHNIAELVKKTPEKSLEELNFKVKDIIQKAINDLNAKGFPNDDESLLKRLKLNQSLSKNTFTIPEKYKPWAEKCIKAKLYEEYKLPDEDFERYYEAFVERDARYAGAAIDKFVKGKAFSVDWLLDKNSSQTKAFSA